MQCFVNVAWINIHGQSRKQTMDHQTNQTTQNKMDQAQIIILWLYYVKMQLSGEGSNARKSRRKEKRTTRSKVDGLGYSGNGCSVGRTRLGTVYHRQNPMWSSRVNPNLMAHKKSCVCFIRVYCVILNLLHFMKCKPMASHLCILAADLEH